MGRKGRKGWKGNSKFSFFFSGIKKDTREKSEDPPKARVSKKIPVKRVEPSKGTGIKKDTREKSGNPPKARVTKKIPVSKNELEEQEGQEGQKEQKEGFKDPKALITPILSQPLPENPAATV